MAPARKRNALARARRRDDEADDASVATGLGDDSQSEASLPSDVDEDADADNSDLSDTEGPEAAKEARQTDQGHDRDTSNGSPRAPRHRPEPTRRRAPSPPIARSEVAFTASKTTDLMRNGLAAGAGAEAEEVDYETGTPAVQPSPMQVAGPGRHETLAERRRREHEDYKKKRDADPAFIPNRGAFFMHDQRSSPHSQGFRQYGPRGGGRGGHMGGPYARPPAREEANSPWQHDLHDTVNQAPPPRSHDAGAAQAGVVPPQHSSAPSAPAPNAPPARNFSTTVHRGNAAVRVLLPGMSDAIHFQNVPIKQHTRLPNHRPPLRRDKPVRISLPPAQPRYIFPTAERSFIFIPRALRPNQQGFGRGRGRGGFGSYTAGFSSRRTSAYGGSVYSPSVAMSRRSSLAREMGRDGLVSPVGSVMSRQGGFVDPARPVVRLPPGGPRMPTAPPVGSPQSATPSGMLPQQPYPLPQKPTFRENWQGQLPMHQPRPQKTVSVAGIESPASMGFMPPQPQEQQPFHQQIPASASGSAPPSEQSGMYPHTRQLSYQSQASAGTPLSNIPERAIHAPAFQPFQQAAYQPQPYAMAPGYYYPQNGAQPYAPAAGMMPMFVPNAAQPTFVMPMAPPQGAPAADPAAGPSMVAYEYQGATYYGDPSQMYAVAPMEGYAQASYAVPGMGGMMTPSPEGAGYYYTQQAMQPMQPGAPVYYPTQ